jgi:hypothetical protein
MGAHVVEEVPNVVKRVLQSGWAVNVDMSDVRFDATKEAFDAPVAPRGANRDALVTNADQLQERREPSALEDEFVVGSYGAWFAMLADGQTQMANQRPAALIDYRRQPGADTRTVIDDAQNGSWLAVVVPHKRQVNAPDAVDTHRCGALVAQLAGDVEQRILVVSDGVADKGFANPSRRMQAVEGVSHFAATGVLTHQGFEAQDFLHNPVGLLAGRWRRAVGSGAGRRAKPWRCCPVRCLALPTKTKSTGVTSKIATSTRSQTSMGKKCLIMGAHVRRQHRRDVCDLL